MSPTHGRPSPPPGEARTLWEEGRRPGRQVVALSTVATLALAALNIALTGELSLFFDLSFVVLCLLAALSVRPQEFFAVGVLPPLLMLATVSVLAGFRPAAVSEEQDPVAQAVVSGLAHHAGALVTGYAITLGVLALRQVAQRSSERVRTPA